MLDSIQSPKDLKALSKEDLPQLCGELRARIIDVMSQVGGHLASNLGSIELSVALHYVFDSPDDTFLFDTSHQVYTHKLLTGRNDKFETIRQYKGLSGFSDPKESPHDHFYAGHAGTALSLALGVEKEKSLSQKDNWVIPLIGDAGFTCGLTLEALNNVNTSMKKLLVVLNDNAMSISKNVGNIKHILSRLINNPSANSLYREIEKLVSSIPTVGPFLKRQGHRFKESIKNLVSNAPYFEEHGLNYVGPVDGHNVIDLVDLFTQLKNSDGPHVVHALTIKGQGLLNAIQNPTSYHGVKPFDPETGKMHPQPAKTTFPKIFGEEVFSLASNDPNLVVITPAMPAGSCLTKTMETYPDRCIDVGIAEGHSVTYAAGIAKNREKKVISSIYATFSQRALDNIYHDVVLQDIPVVFGFDRGGIAGGDGATHNGIYDIGFLKGMPGLIIAQPRDGKTLRELLSSSFDWQRPAVIRYPNLPTKDEPAQKKRTPGTAEILRKGNTIALLGLGVMCDEACKLADLLSELGYTPTVIDPVFVKPLDEELLGSVFETHKYVVTIEEHALSSGFGSIINDFIVRCGYNHLQVHNAGIGEHFVEHGKHADLWKEEGLTAGKLIDMVKIKFKLSPQHEKSTSLS